MLGSRLKELREARGNKQSEIARHINRSVQAYSQYELNKRTPDLDTLISIAEFYDVSTDYLLGLTTTKKLYVTDTSLLKLYHSDLSGLSDAEISKVADYIDLLRSSKEKNKR